ncbi:AHH domain-containing protein [Flavobacterium sp. UBA7682]|uniref:AHH domain-containing protein n=1 Tax=Flavobacterium sp. UBA7682 TaxID=1946560 RepID=UPI0025C070B3|nr:AHH domain-containing protein [Flavobacterium sp. UBA7682]
MVQKSGVWGRLVDLPLQKHHLLTKYGAWGKTFNKVLKRYGLDVKKSFNIVKVHHKGMHPDSYHQEMYKRLLKIDEKANGDKEVFLKEFEKEITKYVQENQEILHKTTKIIGE